MESKGSRSASLSCLLDSGANLTVDGALATELEARGCDLDDPLWSAKVLLEQPQLIKQVHRDYFDAGAEIAITSSYQATPQGFAGRGIAEAEALELVALSVRLADEARSEHLAENPDAAPLLIAGSVGPYGAYLATGVSGRLRPHPARVQGVPPAAHRGAGGGPGGLAGLRDVAFLRGG